jgi:hypothetical protein
MSNERTSVFLESRVAQLRQVVAFFVDKRGAAGTRRLLVFLTQIEFWNWEFDCLRYAAEGFAGRALGWRTPPSGVEEGLVELGFRVKRQALDEVREELRQHGGVVASVSVPREQYDELVSEWNALLTRVEDLFDSKRIADEVGTGARLKTDLAAYRKGPLREGAEMRGLPSAGAAMRAGGSGGGGQPSSVS